MRSVGSKTTPQPVKLVNLKQPISSVSTSGDNIFSHALKLFRTFSQTRRLLFRVQALSLTTGPGLASLTVRSVFSCLIACTGRGLCLDRSQGFRRFFAITHTGTLIANSVLVRYLLRFAFNLVFVFDYGILIALDVYP